MLKKISRAPFLSGGIGFFISIYLKFVYKTTKWHVIGQQAFGDHIQGNATIACFWHHRVAMIPFMWQWRHKKIIALISASATGVMIKKAFKRLNVDSIGGSSNRHAISSYRKLLKELGQGNVVGIIPDGPTGPAFVAKPGFVKLAIESGATITPIAFSISRYKTLKTWDQMVIPLPFARGVFIYGDSISVPMCSGENFQSFCRFFEKRMTDLEHQADRLLMDQG